MASLSEPAEASQERVLLCLACGAPLEVPLSVAGSLRCLDCRAENAPLQAEFVELWQEHGADF